MARMLWVNVGARVVINRYRIESSGMSVRVSYGCRALIADHNVSISEGQIR